MFYKVFLITIFTIVILPCCIFAQTYNQDYFINKWSRQQLNITEEIVMAWLEGQDKTIISSHIIELIRIEALIASTYATNVTLFMPIVGNVTLEEVPGKLLGLMLLDAGLPFGPERFFENSQFSVIPIRNSESSSNIIESQNENNCSEVGNDIK